MKNLKRIGFFGNSSQKRPRALNGNWDGIPGDGFFIMPTDGKISLDKDLIKNIFPCN